MIASVCKISPGTFEHMCRFRGGTGGPDPPEKSQKIEFLHNSGSDPLKNYEATEPALNVWPS